MGALTGIRIVEMSAIGPVPLGVMLLADLGAEVIRVDRIAAVKGMPGGELAMHGLSRGRKSIGVDLKHEQGREAVLKLADGADVFVEGYRPGVAERLGIGPDECLSRNPALIYARVTGWGQEGPFANMAGHDIDYAAIAGALHAVGRPDSPPVPPLNYIADFGGGGTYLAIGVLAALHERTASGQGQVIDVAMVDGTASLTAFFHGLRQMGMWTDERGANLLDGGAPFYDCYETSDGKYMAVGAIEPQFYAALLERLDLEPDDFPQNDKAAWPDNRKRFAEVFASKTRDEWESRFEGSDACVAPVLTFTEAPDHPTNTARDLFVRVGDQIQPAPAPRLSRTPAEVTGPVPQYGEHTDEVLTSLGFSVDEIASLREQGAIA